MTSKKRRQRGSRTHSGGSHKNRRGAGHRGGRGRAGRDKHEFHNYEPLGKHGFSRPEKAKEEVLTIEVRELDEDAALLAADGLAEDTGDGYRLDARDVVEDGHEADVVKVLGGGQVRKSLDVTADAFSDSARELLADAGGEAALSERGAERLAALEDEGETENEEVEEATNAETG
ncbi:MAG TPA: uL15m family ribosomal protein [Halococcus sp.]|nr:uL15m family ribosomal protein [Halococcus sp.]